MINVKFFHLGGFSSKQLGLIRRRYRWSEKSLILVLNSNECFQICYMLFSSLKNKNYSIYLQHCYLITLFFCASQNFVSFFSSIIRCSVYTGYMQGCNFPVICNVVSLCHVHWYKFVQPKVDIDEDYSRHWNSLFISQSEYSLLSVPFTKINSLKIWE